MNSKLLLLLAAVLSLGIGHANAKRKAPKDVPPVTFQGVKYSAPHWGLANDRKQNGGYIEAAAKDTGKLLWELRVYEIRYDRSLETDVQDVFITSLKIVNGNLEILNEAGDKFVVDVGKRKVIVGAGHVYRFKDTGR
jgi:hypothetical protein